MTKFITGKFYKTDISPYPPSLCLGEVFGVPVFVRDGETPYVPHKDRVTGYSAQKEVERPALLTRKQREWRKIISEQALFADTEYQEMFI